MNKFEAVLLISPESSSTILTDNIKSFEDLILRDGSLKNGVIHCYFAKIETPI